MNDWSGSGGLRAADGASLATHVGQKTEEEGRAMHPMLDFIGKHVLALFPETGGETRDPTQRLRRAITQVETQLRKLRDVPAEYR